ncbi:MAG TPA: glycoside hydrolase family 52 protein, partial [Treponemataceae bacterium]|nr:glycoside hydrolase family 52 protein [Treponemataceae bacterium]
MSITVTNSDFYSLHGMWGAFSCLALGRIGKGAGIVVGDVQPPKHGLFAGYRRGKGKARLLPFSPGVNVGIGEEAYHLPAKPQTPAPECNWFKQNEIKRTMSFSGEQWTAEDLSFKVISFFGAVPDPSSAKPAELKKAVRPAILVELTFDNSKGTEPMLGFFGMQGIRRLLSDSTNGSLSGFAYGTQWGYAALAGKDVEEVMDWSVLNTGLDTYKPIRKLAAEGLIRWQVGIGEKKSVIVALGAYR